MSKLFSMSKSRKTEEEKHFLELSANKSLWRDFKALMQKESIKSFTVAFRELMQGAIKRGRIVSRR